MILQTAAEHNRISGILLIRRTLLTALLLIALSDATFAQSTWPLRDWSLADPASVGLDAKALASFDADITAGKYGYIDSMLVIRYGKIAFERYYKHGYDKIYGAEAKKPGPLNPHSSTGPYNYFNPWWHPYYRRGDLHSMQSVTKTITSIVIGVAIARKEFPDIDTPVLKFFEASKVAAVDERKRRMTIRHLLTMTAGLDWKEDLPYNDPNNTASLLEASFDWVKFTIDRPMAVDPGTVFNYNSGATQLLSYIFTAATGQDIEEYAAKYLFAPLGIEHYYWKRTPTGLADTEGGLYLMPRDLAKIGYLFLKNGEWNGKQIVTPDWVKLSVTPATSVSATVKYGLKWWLYPYNDGSSKFAWAGSGFGGQKPIVLPDYEIVLVFTGWNILGGKSLSHRVAIDRAIGAVVKSSQFDRGGSRP
jgi:CubicO group peptidase (beta-lactamase class C family)